MKNKIEALYIHIPFCSSICIYCDFFKIINNDQKRKEYLHYLIKEAELKKNLFKDLKTIYIGGGTPSKITIPELYGDLSMLLKIIYSGEALNIEEFTFEVNPNDLTKEYLKALTDIGVNRISLGVQALDENLLKFLRRSHKKAEIIKSIEILKEEDFRNISCDLMYGLPGDSWQRIKKDLDFMIKNQIPHISTYSLILEEKTILYALYKKGEYQIFDPDQEAKLYYKIVSYLKAHGYNHYELSNFALPGYEAKHNLTYWENKPYLGLGANASYYYNNTRYTNINNFQKYYLGIDSKELIFLEKQNLSLKEQMIEEFILGLRLEAGVDLKTFEEKFQASPFTIFPVLDKLIEEEKVIFSKNKFKISEKYLYTINSILVEFLD
ncbi:MAG TPA: radical SAM family heme chaperone HemW [Acholeplasma sp.]|jgi:putative oxygen-independent coproporphyrinogen III oxidase|nr:radical SAM family heme chaperone HemW [Acholeplasma sp.]